MLVGLADFAGSSGALLLGMSGLFLSLWDSGLLSGQLTLLGKTAPLTLKANQFNCYDSPMLKREVCGGDFEATIDRTQWDMNYGVEWGFPKNVRLVVQIEAVKQ